MKTLAPFASGLPGLALTLHGPLACMSSSQELVAILKTHWSDLLHRPALHGDTKHLIRIEKHLAVLSR